MLVDVVVSESESVLVLVEVEVKVKVEVTRMTSVTILVSTMALVSGLVGPP